MAYANVNSIFHGLGYSYGSGSSPSVALDRSGTVLEVHKNEYGVDLYYKLGNVKRGTIHWEDSRRYDTGATPQVALNNKDVAVEVHKNELTGYTLFYRVGDVKELTVDWGQSIRISHGRTPAVALNDHGSVVEMHKAEYWNELWYNVGSVKDQKLTWLGGAKLPGKGITPKVALNNAGVVVEVHRDNTSNRLYFRVGTVAGNRVGFEGAHLFGNGADPSVALLDDGTVIVTFERGKELFRRIGRVINAATSIQWDADAIHYDDGLYSSVAAAAGMSVEVHEGKTLKSLWFSNSLLTNRASWMNDRLNTLGDRPLRTLVLPASHDAGMYGKGVIEQLGKTQSLSIWGQLTAGVRYFDLRPRWKSGSGRFVMYHGPVDGPSLSEVLADIKRFAGEKDRRELVILKFSHFNNIDDARYKMLTDQISASLDPWLVKSAPKGKRLAEMTLNEYLVNGKTAILVVVDGDHPVRRKTPGYWVYRDWYSSTPGEGDFRVHDVWSDTHIFNDMKDDQFKKFVRYDGVMQHDRSLVCDLFLLSWTLTAPTYVWWFSMEANRRLGRYLQELSRPNYYRQIPNLLYVDYVEFARVTDVAIMENERPLPVSDNASRPKRSATKRPRAAA
jgi:hypothetical protein